MADATYADLFGSDLILHCTAADAGSLFTDAAATNPASDGNTVNAWTGQADAVTTSPLTDASNGPTYSADYASTGYPALVFNGTSNVLSLSSTGITTNARMFVLMAFTYISGSGTHWSRGNASGQWARSLGTTTSISLQSAAGTQALTGLATGKKVAAFVSGSGQSQIDVLGYCLGDTVTNHFPATVSAVFTLGALNTGSFSNWGNLAIHEFLVIGDSCEWGQVLRGAKLLRTAWGVSDPNGTPQAATGGGKFDPLGRGALVI